MREKMTKKLVQNQVRCNKCGDEPFSAHRHDFKSCKCGNVSVDGGLSYTRRLSNDFSSVTELSMSLEESVIADITDAVKWGRETNRNDFGIALAVLRALNKNGLLDKTKL